MSPRIAPMHVHCEFTTVECREPLLELCSGDNGSRLLNIEVKCSHLRAKTGRISGHLPTEHGGNWPEGSTESAPVIKFCLEGSIKPESPWLVPLQGRKMPENGWKSVIHLFC